LLKDLQQAVRASFPPEDLMIARSGTSDSSGTPALQDVEMEASGAARQISSQMSTGEPELAGSFGSEWFEHNQGHSGTSALARHLDLRAVGATPPPELFYASRGVCAGTTRRSKQSPQQRPKPDQATAGSAYPELIVQRCPVGGRAGDVESAASISSASAEQCGTCTRGDSHASSLSAGSREVGTFITDLEAGDEYPHRSNEELLRLSSLLQSERSGLGSELEKLGSFDEVMNGLKMPLFFEARKHKSDTKRRRPRQQSASPSQEV